MSAGGLWGPQALSHPTAGQVLQGPSSVCQASTGNAQAGWRSPWQRCPCPVELRAGGDQ